MINLFRPILAKVIDIPNQVNKLRWSFLNIKFDIEINRPPMSSIIEGYNYDIFISYRLKDNKGDKCYQLKDLTLILVRTQGAIKTNTLKL
jgi:hypothetical protein